MWQEMMVGILVVAAFYYVIRGWLPVGKKSARGCGGCGSCHATKSCSNPEDNAKH